MRETVSIMDCCVPMVVTYLPHHSEQPCQVLASSSSTPPEKFEFERHRRIVMEYSLFSVFISYKATREFLLVTLQKRDVRKLTPRNLSVGEKS